jgi:pilus assembly protein TadC
MSVVEKIILGYWIICAIVEFYLSYSDNTLPQLQRISFAIAICLIGFVVIPCRLIYNRDEDKH